MPGLCPCMSLQRGTVIVATVDVVLNIILLVLYVLALIGFLTINLDSSDKVDLTESEKTQLIIFAVFALIICVCQIALAIYLRRSAYQNYYQGCKKWLIISTILFIFSIISMSLGIAAGSNALDITANVIGLVYRLYVLAVVYSFMRELINGGLPNYYTNDGATYN